jgi:hypothetical protein
VLPAPKGGRLIRLVLSGAARELPKATRHVAGSPYLFPKISDVEKPFGKDAIGSAWQRIRVFAGLADFTSTICGAPWAPMQVRPAPTPSWCAACSPIARWP